MSITSYIVAHTGICYQRKLLQKHMDDPGSNTEA